MNIENALRKEHSKKQCSLIGHYIGGDASKFAVLMKHFLSGEYRLAQRAAWPASNCIRQHPHLLKPYYAKLINGLSDPTLHPAVLRNTLRIFEAVDVPMRYHGRLLDACFRFIASNEIPVAIKAYAITIIGRLSKTYPDLLQELKSIVEKRWLVESPAFHARVKKLKLNLSIQ